MTPTIALFIHQPRCSVQCANGMIQAFSTHYKLKLFTWHELEDNFFDDVDIKKHSTIWSVTLEFHPKI